MIAPSVGRLTVTDIRLIGGVDGDGTCHRNRATRKTRAGCDACHRTAAARRRHILVHPMRIAIHENLTRRRIVQRHIRQVCQCRCASAATAANA